YAALPPVDDLDACGHLSSKAGVSGVPRRRQAKHAATRHVREVFSVLTDRVAQPVRQLRVDPPQGFNDPQPLGAADDSETQVRAGHQEVERVIPARCAGKVTSVVERSPTSPASGVYSSRM